MSDFLHSKNEFLQKIIAVIEENIADELFGVSELAERMNMSRSNLLRKVKTLTNSSVSVFIRQVRLHHAKELLKDESITVSEISYKVGFNSTSYFTKCFREEFGYTPGEEKRNKTEVEDVQVKKLNVHPKRKKILVGFLVGIVSLVLVLYFIKNRTDATVKNVHGKSIAVLPFKNDSNDSSNVYIINGLMEAILDNLQKVEDLRVTSRTSVEKYRNSTKTIAELTKELEVGYFVEGSGQKIGNKIVLTVQLIEAGSDTHIWSRRFESELDNIFQLQSEVAKNIANEVEVLITPEEQRRIEKVLTKNIAAYDFYLKGIEFANQETNEGLKKAIVQFKKAIEVDDQFAAAYAYIAICYYYHDIFLADKKYSLEIKSYADRAFQLDSELVESLVARALYYMQDANYTAAIVNFEKALEINPNAGRVHNILTDIYTSYLPDTRKYLKHAILGIKSHVASQDSIAASFSYLHLSNALVQSGFIKEAKNYVEKSLNYYSGNLYAEYLNIYIKLAENFNLERTKNDLIRTLQKDTSRLDILQEIAKVSYTMEDYHEAWKYYNKYITLKNMYQLDIYPAEDVKIAFVLEQLGRNEEAEGYYNRYKAFSEHDQSIYKSLIKCSYFASQNNVEEAMKHLREFTKQKEFMYWIVLFLDKDPIINKLSSHPDYSKTLKKINDNFWIQHKSIREVLDDEGVL